MSPPALDDIDSTSSIHSEDMTSSDEDTSSVDDSNSQGSANEMARGANTNGHTDSLSIGIECISFHYEDESSDGEETPRLSTCKKTITIDTNYFLLTYSKLQICPMHPPSSLFSKLPDLLLAAAERTNGTRKVCMNCQIPSDRDSICSASPLLMCAK